MKKIILTIILTLSLNAQLVDAVAIVVKGSAITLYDIKNEMKNSGLDQNRAADVLIRQKLEELEIEERKIEVTSSEVYEDIKQTAQRNNMSINAFYDAVRESNGLSSTELKEKIRQKLLSQKLYSAIAYSSVSQPEENDIQEYFELHKDEFMQPRAFNVVIYVSKDQGRLAEKIDNPMFYSPDIMTDEQSLPSNRISPDLAELLSKTPVNSFTPIVPDGKGGFMSFYIKDVEASKDVSIDDVRTQIINSIMATQREQVLGEYFARLRLNADIQTIRMPQ